jgi:ubiquinone/menaquinone biosynthesis C-methylase UbiE
MKLKIKYYRLLLKAFEFLGLYPNINLYHFYCRPWNTFMPCKVFEFKEMLRGVHIQPSDVILDIGCGDGALALILGKGAAKVVGVDINSSAIDRANSMAAVTANSIQAEFFCEKLEEAGFADGSFDKIFSFSVIEHIPNYREVLREAYRVLKPGGQMVISVDSLMGMSPERIERHRTVFSVQHYFTPINLRKLLEEIGFTSVEVCSIFTSQVARSWFSRVMDDPKERFNPIRSLLVYRDLRNSEKNRKPSDEGLFVIAKCRKEQLLNDG